MDHTLHEVKKNRNNGPELVLLLSNSSAPGPCHRPLGLWGSFACAQSCCTPAWRPCLILCIPHGAVCASHLSRVPARRLPARRTKWRRMLGTERLRGGSSRPPARPRPAHARRASPRRVPARERAPALPPAPAAAPLPAAARRGVGEAAARSHPPPALPPPCKSPRSPQVGAGPGLRPPAPSPRGGRWQAGKMETRPTGEGNKLLSPPPRAASCPAAEGGLPVSSRGAPPASPSGVRELGPAGGELRHRRPRPAVPPEPGCALGWGEAAAAWAERGFGPGAVPCQPQETGDTRGQHPAVGAEAAGRRCAAPLSPQPARGRSRWSWALPARPVRGAQGWGTPFSTRRSAAWGERVRRGFHLGHICISGGGVNACIQAMDVFPRHTYIVPSFTCMSGYLESLCCVPSVPLCVLAWCM